jgi:hypothetical protein
MIGNLEAESRRQISENALGTLSCKSSDFRKRIRKVINRAR